MFNYSRDVKQWAQSRVRFVAANYKESSQDYAVKCSCRNYDNGTSIWNEYKKLRNKKKEKERERINLESRKGRHERKKRGRKE
jgi:hypothetical protein